MSTSDRPVSSPYIEWAKLRSHAKYNLASSGVVSYPLRELGVTMEDIELSGPSLYGFEPLQQALAAKTGAPVDCIVSAVGTSLCNHLAMAAIIEPGDEVLVEQPVYEPLLGLARYLGGHVTRFQRRREEDFRLNPDEIKRNITPQTRLIVITNLHNPSSTIADESTLRRVGEIARGTGARVLVDEVYLEAVGVQAPRLGCRTAFLFGNEFVVTSSLTKAYGLSGLRCGWVLAEPELAKKIWRLNDLFDVIPAHPAEKLSVVALKRLVQISVRARALLEENRTIAYEFLRSRDELECTFPEFGTVVFPRLKSGKVDELCALLRTKFETTIVPGRFFEMPDHFRLGLGGDAEALAAGLDRLGSALNELAAN